MSFLTSRVPPTLRRQLLRTFSTSRRCAADHVRIVEVGPRDGLQNEKNSIPLDTKLDLISRLAKTGVTHMEAGSFVPAKWVPQMASTAEILEAVISKPPSSPHPIAYNYLVPNIRGLENMVKIVESHPQPTTSQDTSYPTPPQSPARESPPILASSNTNEISLFAAATESFSRANTNCSIAESLSRSLPIIALAQQQSVRVRGYVSVALGCPYEGADAVSPAVVADMTAKLLEMGCAEVSVADTTGMGTPPKTRTLLKALKAAGVPMERLALHFHDTYGQALVNVLAGLEEGVRIFDSSVGGLGGCPYSKGATGNVATEDLVHLLHSLGIETGVDLETMARIGGWINDVLGKGNEARAGKAILSRLNG